MSWMMFIFSVLMALLTNGAGEGMNGNDLDDVRNIFSATQTQTQTQTAAPVAPVVAFIPTAMPTPTPTTPVLVVQTRKMVTYPPLRHHHID